jgi:hypothetical protein
LLHLRIDPYDRVAERKVAGTRDLDEARRRDALCRVRADFDRDELILRAVQDEGRHAHGRKNMTDVDLPVHPIERLQHPGARPVAEIVDERLEHVVVVGPVRAHDLPSLRPRPVHTQCPLDFALIGLLVAAPGKVGGPHRLR